MSDMCWIQAMSLEVGIPKSPALAGLFSNAVLRLPLILCTKKEADLSALLARYESIQIVFPTAVPARRITASGALRCTPGSVANPL